ncbi:hypothetical protein MKW94_015181 [Papaver nudicaule]|uniref:diphosphoinositol-polyphosphate diphosphatase n=1 Tax=Papaver nudicaule TaxID=74823 RepID=A0AA41S645_PAPNU|nr:hypothetical protein [Papaver nudicaule]
MGSLVKAKQSDVAGDDFITPCNFAIVERGIYRCSFPDSLNFSFIETLHLRSILCLCPESYPEENFRFLQSKNIQLFQFGIQGTKEPSMVSKDMITEALEVLLDVRNHPILIHCKQGKHRTGCVVGCYRKLKNWCMPCVLQEYHHFSGSKARPTDMKFIENYDAACVSQRLYNTNGYKQRRNQEFEYGVAKFFLVIGLMGIMGMG